MSLLFACLFSKELGKESMWSWVDGDLGGYGVGYMESWVSSEVGSIWEELAEGNCGQDILYKLFQLTYIYI